MRPYFTRTTVEVYTQGECYALALELHRLTGWPIVGVVNGTFELCDEEEADGGIRLTFGMGHFAVRTPEQLLLDVTGARLPVHMLLHWQAGELVTPEDHDAFVAELKTLWRPVDGLEPVDYMKRRDRRVARRVLDLYRAAPGPTDFAPLEWWTLDPHSIGMDLSNAKPWSMKIGYQVEGIVPRDLPIEA